MPYVFKIQYTNPTPIERVWEDSPYAFPAKWSWTRQENWSWTWSLNEIGKANSMYTGVNTQPYD